ncbi:MAG TPA: serine/threonine protein kinase, partial [Cyanobacteria bacterium UBA11148]|nr:serine/threonine protein kinase [Cyanobacteria bacterium UBA11148]
MTWAAGQQLYGGRYLIERLLGEGGFGVTYLATDKKGKHVVIKTLKDEVLKSSQLESFRRKYLQDFLNEALRLALSRHPHIVQIENAFHEGELPCMVMEYIEGEDLWQRVNRQGVLSEAEALLYIQQIGDALTVTHEKGLLHRDVKPQNILVRQGCQEAVLIDFGMAREFIPDVELKHTQQVTHCFAPIEQYAKEAIRGEYTDIYALAATLYYLLTKQVPPPSPARAAGVMLKPPQ